MFRGIRARVPKNWCTKHFGLGKNWCKKKQILSSKKCKKISKPKKEIFGLKNWCKENGRKKIDVTKSKIFGLKK